MTNIYYKPTAIIILNGEKLKPFSSKTRDKTGMTTLASFIQNRIGCPSEIHQPRKRNKGFQIGKK